MKNRTANISYLISITAHLLLMFIFLFIKFSIDPPEDDYVTIGFGAGGSGNIMQSPPKVQPKLKQQIKKEEKVELPVAKNQDEENLITESKKKEEKKEVTKIDKNSDSEKENIDDGINAGGFGYDIDFGGKRVRKVYSYFIPPYPEGVAKEIDVKLRFTIMPDGTIGKIFPLIKADSRLESAAINALRQWRFEPLPGAQSQQVQTAVIVFPFRLQ